MRYGGLRRVTITVRPDGLLDVVRERGESGDTFRGLANLDEVMEVLRAHGPPLTLAPTAEDAGARRPLLFTMRMSESEQDHMRLLALDLGATSIADMLRRLVDAARVILRGARARGAAQADAPSPRRAATAKK